MANLLGIIIPLLCEKKKNSQDLLLKIPSSYDWKERKLICYSDGILTFHLKGTGFSTAAHCNDQKRLKHNVGCIPPGVRENRQRCRMDLHIPI